MSLDNRAKKLKQLWAQISNDTCPLSQGGYGNAAYKNRVCFILQGLTFENEGVVKTKEWQISSKVSRIFDESWGATGGKRWKKFFNKKYKEISETFQCTM